MKESSLENELELFYEYIISIEYLLINFNDYINRKKTLQKVIKKNELLNNFVLKYINKNIPTKLSLHMKCVKNKKFYERLFLCAFYHIIINYIIHDPLFTFQKELECKSKEDIIKYNEKNENDENEEKYLSDNKKIVTEKESDFKNEIYLINWENSKELELSENTHIGYSMLKIKEKEKISNKLHDIIARKNIRFHKLNDELFIQSSTYEQICDFIYSSGILCYIYGFYKFFKITNIKIIKNKKGTYNFFNWIYSIKFNVLESIRLNTINKKGNNFKEKENNKHMSSNNIKNNYNGSANKENVNYNSNSSGRNYISSNKSSILNYRNHSNNSCSINELNKEIIMNTNYDGIHVNRSKKNKTNSSNENRKHAYCSTNLNLSSTEEKNMIYSDKTCDRDNCKNMNIKNEEYDNYFLKSNFLNGNPLINKNNDLDKNGNFYIDFEFYSYMVLKKKEIEKIFLLYEKEIYNINNRDVYKEDIHITSSEKYLNNRNVKYVDHIHPGLINSCNYNNVNEKERERKKNEFIKMHLENLYQKMKSIKASRIYIWVYLYVNYAFDFLFNNNKKNYKKINNFNLCFDEGQYENSNMNTSCNISNNYCNNITKGNENNLRKKKIILFNLSGLSEFINKRTNFEKKQVTTNLKNYIDNELFQVIKECDTEYNVMDENKNKNDNENEEYHKIRFYQNNEPEQTIFENNNNDKNKKYMKEELIIDNDLNYAEIKVDENTVSNDKRIKKIEHVDDIYEEKNNVVSIKINEFINDYIYMFISYVCLNVIKLSILLIEKFNLTIPNKYMDLSCYIYICQKNKLNSNILFFVNKYHILHYLFSNDIANKDIKENYYIYKNIEYQNVNSKPNDINFLIMEDIITIKHIRTNRDNKMFHNTYSNNHKIKNNFSMTPNNFKVNNNISNEIKCINNSNYKFSNNRFTNFNDYNNFYLNNNMLNNSFNNSTTYRNNDYFSSNKKEYFDNMNNNCLQDNTTVSYIRNSSTNNGYMKYKYADNNFMNYDDAKGRSAHAVNCVKHSREGKKRNVLFSNLSEEVKRNNEYNNFSVDNYLEENLNNTKHLYENLDNVENERKRSDPLINKKHIDAYNKNGTFYSFNNKEEKYYNKYQNIEEDANDYFHGLHYKRKENIEVNDIRKIINNTSNFERNNMEIVFETNNIKNINFLNYYLYPLKLNVVYDLYLNDILMSETKASNIIDYCKGDKTLELELIKQKIMNGNIKYAIKLIKAFNYELLLFPNLFYYLNFKSYNYLLNTFDKKYIIYYLYDNPKYLKIYLNSLIKKKNFEYCIIALYFLYPSHISPEDTDFRTFFHLFLKRKRFKKINYNVYSEEFQDVNESTFRELNKNSFNNDNNSVYNYNSIYSFLKNECIILNDVYFTFKNEMVFDELRKVYKLSDLCKYFDIFKNFKKINLEIIRNSFHYLTETNGTCSCQKKYICIKDLGSSLKEVAIIETYNDFLVLYEHIRKNEKVIFIDAEWKCAIFRENPIISIFQIALKNNSLSYIIDVKKISVENYEINYYISELFRDESIIKIGVAFLNNDILHFRKYYDILTMLIYEKYNNILIEENTVDEEKNNYHNLMKYRMERNNKYNCDIFLKKIMKNIYEYGGSDNYLSDNKNYYFHKNNFYSNDKKKERHIDKNFNLNDDTSYKNVFPVNYFLKNKKNVALIKKLLTTKCSSCNKIGIYSCIHKYYNLEFICNKYYDDLKMYFPFLKKNMSYSVKIFGKSLFPEKEVNKECQIINWNFRPLSSISVEYAILDVLILKNFFNLIQTKLSINIENAL